MVGQGAFDGFPECLGNVDADTGDVRHRPIARRSRHDRPGESQSSGLAQPTFEAGDAAQLAEQADLPDHDRPRLDGPVSEGGRQSQRERQVQSRLTHGQPTGQVRIDVMAAEGDPGASAQHSRAAITDAYFGKRR